MAKLTAKEIEGMSDRDFVIRMLQERARELSPYTPVGRRLTACIENLIRGEAL